MDLASFQRRHGLCFRDESLLRQAMTHRSWPHEQGGPAGLEGNYERLEFLGDAVLAFAVTRMLYDRFPDMPEGELTRLRSALVRSETLADIATELELGAFLRLGRGEDQNGGRQRRSILGDAFEALLGAIFIDRGQGAAEDFVRAWLGPLIDGLQAADLLDPRSRLQEICQAALLATPVYETRAESGPDHQKQFTVAVCVLDEEMGRGQGNSKQAAAQVAARAALELLRREGRLPQSGGE